MIGSRQFSALSDKIVMPISGGNVTGALTLAVLVKPTAGNTQSVFLEDGGRNVEMYRETDGLVGWCGVGSKATSAIPLDSEWQVLAFTRPAGAAQTPRLHRVRLNGSASVHANGATTQNDQAPVTNWTLGWYDGRSYGFNGNLAAAGVWKSALSDAAIDALVTEAAWIAAAPDAWWSERDGFAADRSSGAARLSIVGTANAVDDPPGFWPYAPVIPRRPERGLIMRPPSRRN